MTMRRLETPSAEPSEAATWQSGHFAGFSGPWSGNRTGLHLLRVWLRVRGNGCGRLTQFGWMDMDLRDEALEAESQDTGNDNEGAPERAENGRILKANATRARQRHGLPCS